MLEQRLIILVSVATAVKFGGWTGSVAGFWGPVQFRAGSWGIALLFFHCLSELSVASHMGRGGSGGLWGGGVCLCLGSWLWGWISWGSFRAWGLVMALSLPFHFILLFFI